MTDNLQLSLYLLALFVASFCTAFGLTKLKMRAKRKRFPELRVGMPLVVRHRLGRSRSHIREVCSDSIVIDAPLSADAHIPLREGEPVKIEVPLIHGVLFFYSEILGRDVSQRSWTIPIPESFSVEDRRRCSRQELEGGKVIRVNHQAAVLLNVSEGGAALMAHSDLAIGDFVRIETPGDEARMACVLEAIPDALDGRLAQRLRVVFS